VIPDLDLFYIAMQTYSHCGSFWFVALRA